jgi:hypothetical protein
MQNLSSWSTAQLLPPSPLRRAFLFVPSKSLCSANYSLPWIVSWIILYQVKDAAIEMGAMQWRQQKGRSTTITLLGGWSLDRCRQSNIHNCHCTLDWWQNLDVEVCSFWFQKFWKVDHRQENLQRCCGSSLEISGWNWRHFCIRGSSTSLPTKLMFFVWETLIFEPFLNHKKPGQMSNKIGDDYWWPTSTYWSHSLIIVRQSIILCDDINVDLH